MATVAEIQSQIDALNDKISKVSGGLGGAGQRTTYETQIRNLQPQLMAARQAEERQQQEQQAQQQQQEQQQQQPQQQEQQQPQPQPQQQATPISQVAPQAAASFGLQGANASFFPNIDPNTGLPILKQDAIDSELKKLKTNELTSFNSNIRDAIYGSGWNAKSDAVQVLNGAAVYGIAKPINAGIMGNPEYQKPNGASVTDQDFINAAVKAGIDPNQYVSTIRNMGQTTTTVNREGLYNAINDKAKDLYSITNVINSTGGRGAAEPHATILFKADGQGNLVPQNDPTTGQPSVQYTTAVRYANPESFMDTYGPFMALLPAVGGILQANGIIPSFGPGTIGSNIGSAAGDLTAGLTNAEIANLPAEELQQYLQNTYGTGQVLNPEQLAAAQQAYDAAAATTGGITADMLPGMNAAATAAGINTLTGGLGSTLSSLGTGAGGLTSAQQALANAFANNGLYNALGAGAGALASYTGAQAQADAAKQAAANQMSMFNTINNQLAPQRGAGYASLNQIRSMLPGQYTTYGETGQPTGTAQGNDYLTHQFGPQDLYAGLAPNYNFMLGQGQQAQQRAANVGGGLIGGNALRGLEDYTQNYAQNAYQNAFGNYQTQRTGIYNTLAGIAGIAQNATNTSANAGQNAVNATSQLGVGSAAAQAAGLQGVANAASGGLQNYQQNQVLQAILGQNQNVAQYQNTASSFPNVA
jgi:hypothetical protein